MTYQRMISDTPNRRGSLIIVVKLKDNFGQHTATTFLFKI
jgi:hypothetical protein